MQLYDKHIGAIRLTALGLLLDREYNYKKDTFSIHVYKLDNDFIVTFSDNGKIVDKKFDTADKAAYIFAMTAWKLMGLE